MLSAACWRVCVGMLLTLALLPLSGCDKAPARTAAAIRPAQTIVAHREEAAEPLEVVGDIEPDVESDVGFQVTGRIAKRLVALGDVVRQGQPLAVLDEHDLQNHLRVAQETLLLNNARLVQSASEVRRRETLYREGWESKAAVEIAQQTDASATASMAAAATGVLLSQDQLDYATLRAPTSGVIAAVDAEVGQVVTAGQVVVKIARLDQRDAVFAISEGDISRIRHDGRVNITGLDNPRLHDIARIAEIAPMADPTTRTFTVKAVLPQARDGMRFGVSVVGDFAPQKARLVILPATALFEEDGAPALWLVDPVRHSVFLRRVALAGMGESRIFVSHGLRDGDVVVVAGVQSLYPDEVVRPISRPLP